MDTPRDPHLPPPAVVDWLLEQDWLETLRKDRDARQSAFEQKRQACEADEMAIKARRWSQDAADQFRRSHWAASHRQ